MAPLLGGTTTTASTATATITTTALPLPPPDYDPAPSRNAFLTVMGVFAFFGVCFLVVALWIRCVGGIESHYERRARFGSRSTPRGSTRKRRGFQEWYHRRSASTPPPTPKRRLVDTKYSHANPSRPKSSGSTSTTSECESLLCGGGSGSSSRRSPSPCDPNIYNTFGRGSRSIPRTPGHHRNWYRNPSSSPSTSPSSSSSSPPERLPTKTRRIPSRAKGTPAPRLSGSPSRRGGDMGSPSRRDTFKRSWTMPTTGAGSKVSKSHRGHGGGGVKGRIPVRRQSTGSSGGGDGARRGEVRTAMGGGFVYKSRGLDVVLEEAGSTPER